MPGILAEEQSSREPLGEEKCSKAGTEMETVQNDGAVSSSSTPSPVENGKPNWQSSTSDSEVNVSSASEPEAANKSPSSSSAPEGLQEPEVERGGAKKEESDSVIYNIHLSLPGVSQPVDVVLMSRDTVHDLLQFALERPECCYRTALSVHHKGRRLDDFFEIGSIEGLEDGDTVDVVEESYTQRDVRLHVQRLKDLLSTNPLQQSLLSSDGLTLSFLSAITSLDHEDVSRSSDLTLLEPPGYSMPHLSASGSCDSHAPDMPLSSFYPPNLDKHFKFPECLKSLCYSSWNPPPSKRKMKGDLLYLELMTLEGQEYFITATPSGFFLNKSTSQENFDPTPRKTPHLHKHLVGLISQISPLFKKNFAQLQKFGESLHAFEILPVPYPVTPWLVPKPEHRPAHFRIDDTMSLRALPDEFVLGQMRDWNEELQTAREFPTDTSTAKIFRDRALFKIHSDFVQACTRGGVAVVDGYLPSLNPGDEPKFRMYMWNNIFFSLAFDGRDHYKEFGGDNAAHVAASADLQGVASFEKLDPKELYMLGTVLVDYRGYRVICQTIIPGLLQREQDSAVVYGSIDTGKNVCMEEQFAKLLKRVGEELHIREHKVRTEKDEVVSIPSSLEVKGIVGNDRRYYALDLFRIFPPDANYMECPEGAKYRHKMAILRPEFLDTFLSFKFMLFLRLIELKQLSQQRENTSSAATDTNQSKSSDTTPSINASNVTPNSANTGDVSNSSDTVDTAGASNSSDTTDAVETAKISDTCAGSTEMAESSGPVRTVDVEEAKELDTANTSDAVETAKISDTCTHPTEMAESSDPVQTIDVEEAKELDTTNTSETAKISDTCTHPTEMAESSDPVQTVDVEEAKELDTANTSDAVEISDTCTHPTEMAESSDPVQTIDVEEAKELDTANATLETAKISDTHTEVANSVQNDNTAEVKGAKELHRTPEKDPTSSSKQPFTSKPVTPPLSSVLPSPARAVISALASNSSTSKLVEVSTEREGERVGVAADGLYLLDTQTLAEEKEVGPDIPCGLADEDLSAMRESEAEPITQPLKGTELEGRPEVVAAFKAALEGAGSTSHEEFVIRFNVDILSPKVQHADEESVMENDLKLVRNAGSFLVESVVPRFVRDCIQLTVTPTDGESLTVAMHAKGINMRYLGQVAILAGLRDDLQHLMCVCLSEMTVRLAKRRLRVLLQHTPLEMTSVAISHFLNCLLSEVRDSKESKEELSLANGVRKKKNKKKGARGQRVAPHVKLTSEMLWGELVGEMEWYYKFNMKYSSLSVMCAETGVRKLSLLREFCKKTGVQVLMRDYDFSSFPVFTDDDITAIFPIVKHTNFRPMEPTTLYEMALSKFGDGQLQLAHELFVNTLQMFVQVYGPMHFDIANCYRHMARIEHMLSDHVNSLSNQHKATLILERVLGVDHSETISAYINLALYCHASNQSASALKLLYRARYLLVLAFGEDHPEMATCDSNIAIILHSVKDYKNSHSFLSNSLVVHNKYHGSGSLQAALTHHLLARSQSFLGDFRAALTHEKITFSIYQKKLGAEHERTKESSQCLKELTEKAVAMQKTINEVTGKGNGAKILAELPGSWGEVVGMVNGMESRLYLKNKPHVARKKGRRVKNSTSPNSGSGQNLP